MPDKVFSVNGFKFGLDKRKAEIESSPEVLWELRDGFINQGGEIEKRKAFKQEYNVSILDTLGDAGTFGYEVTSEGHTVFGSALVFGTTPTLSQPVLASALPGGVTYQQLKHPAVVELQTYDRTKHRMTSVIHSHNYGGFAWVVAQFADTKVFVYYNTVLIADFVAGLILPHLAGNTNANRNLLATHLINLINSTEEYTGSDPTGDGNLDITGALGSNYSVEITEDSTAGVITRSDQSDGAVTQEGVSAVGTFRILAGSAGVKATGTLTSTGTAPANNDTVTIGSKVYTFKTALTPLEGEVLIGASAAVALANLKLAINRTDPVTNDGVNYKIAAAHSQVEGTTLTATTLLIQALAGGTAGNAVATLEGSLQLSWGGAVMSGGTDPNYVSKVEIGPPGGPFTNIIDSNVPWVTTDELTATAIATEINSVSSGFTATSFADQVKIIGAADQGDAYNDWVVRVTAVGDVCVGDLFATFSSTGISFTVTGFFADGVNLPTTVPISEATLEATIVALSVDINSETSIHGYLSCPRGKELYVSKAVTSSEDDPVDFVATVTNGAVVWSDTPLVGASVRTDPTSLAENIVVNTAKPNVISLPVACIADGLAGPLLYSWRLLDHVVSGTPFNPTVGRTPTSPTSQTTTFRADYPNRLPHVHGQTMLVDTYICEVTDRFGVVVTSSIFTLTTILRY